MEEASGTAMRETEERNKGKGDLEEFVIWVRDLARQGQLTRVYMDPGPGAGPKLK